MFFHCDPERVREKHPAIHAMLREAIEAIPGDVYPTTRRMIRQALDGAEEFADPQALYELLDRAYTALPGHSNADLNDRMLTTLSQCAGEGS
jgi:hypothetical protein